MQHDAGLWARGHWHLAQVVCSLLALMCSCLDACAAGISLDGTAGGETHGGAGGALGLDLQIPKNLSFGDLGAFDFNLGRAGVIMVTKSECHHHGLSASPGCIRLQESWMSIHSMATCRGLLLWVGGLVPNNTCWATHLMPCS